MVKMRIFSNVTTCNFIVNYKQYDKIICKIDRIDDYLLDRMTEVERMAFAKEIGNNKELQEQLKFTEMLQRVSNKKIEKTLHEW